MWKNASVFIVVALLPCSPLAKSARISVDSADAHLGTITEGETNIVTHAFIIKNTGDSVLRIQSVRPG